MSPKSATSRTTSARPDSPVPAAPRSGTRRRARHEPRHGRAQRGLSLVELMISMVLGLLVVAAVYNTWMGTTRSSRFTQGLQSLQDNGRHGVSTLQRGLRLAGYSPAASIEPFELAASGDDRIVLRMHQAFDCNGVSTAGRDGVTVDTYAYDANDRTITCLGDSSGAQPMPIIDDVDGFRLLYGIDETGGATGDGDGVPERYVPHASVTSADDVAAIRFALLVASDAPVRRRARAEDHVLLDTVKSMPSDRVVRTVFTSTVKLRNR